MRKEHLMASTVAAVRRNPLKAAWCVAIAWSALIVYIAEVIHR